MCKGINSRSDYTATDSVQACGIMRQGMDASWTGKTAGLGHDGVTLFHAPGRVGVGCCVQGVALKGFWLSVIARERPGLQKATPQKRAHFWRSSLQSRRLPSAIVPSALAQAPSSGSQSISGLKSADRGHNKGVDQKRYRSVISLLSLNALPGCFRVHPTLCRRYPKYKKTQARPGIFEWSQADSNR